MAYDKRISLDPRLSLIADLVGICPVCADIGSDHGRLGAFLLQNARCDRVVLTDISAASLEKARRLIAMLGFTDRADFCVGSGALALHTRVNVAVIAGMGGETIAGILENAEDRLRGARLILQPNVAAEQLRRALCRCGWRIADERLARDGRRIYPIIVAEEGNQALTDAEALIGPVLMRTHTKELADYRAFKLRVLTKALDGARGGADAQTAAQIERELRMWEELAI